MFREARRRRLSLAAFLAGLARCAAPSAGPFDLDGAVVDPFATAARATVFVVTRSDCPIANRYAPELARLHHDFADRGAALWLVYPDPRETAATIRAHLERFRLPWTPLRDPSGALVSRLGATVSPEAAVVDPSGRLVYRGRIDDRFPAFGIFRPPREHDLRRAIEAVLDGTAGALVTTDAVGCYLSDLR